MRILLDESVPRGLRKVLEGHLVTSVAEQGWSSLSNGKLLKRAASEFDVLVTADQNLPHQQNLSQFSIAIVVVVARTNQLLDYLPLKDDLLQAVENSPAEALQWIRG